MRPITAPSGSLFAWLTRAVQTSWDLKPGDLNVCKLTWGLLFWPLGFVYRFAGDEASRFFGCGITSISLTLVTPGKSWAAQMLDTLLMGIGIIIMALAIASFVIHRLTLKQIRLHPDISPEGLRIRNARQIDDCAERARSRIQEFAEVHRFTTALIVVPVLAAGRLIQLVGIMLAPIVVPIASLIAEKASPSEDRLNREELLFNLGLRENRSPLSEGLHSFHNRTCRRIIVE